LQRFPKERFMANKRSSSRGRLSSVSPYTEPKPIAGPDAFEDLRDPSHIQSQAATMLLIGSHLRGDAPAVQARAGAAMGITALAEGAGLRAVDALPEEDVLTLGFPRLQAGTPRFRSTDLQRSLGVRFGPLKAAAPTGGEVRAATKSLPAAVDAFYTDANAETAARLLEAGLRHPNELVRVAAAASYFEVGAEALRVIGVLEHGLNSKDRLTRDVAAYALTHVDPANPKLEKLLKSKARISRRKPSRTSTIIHGTWAPNSPWWQPPNGDFWSYVRDNVDLNLYAAQDRFGWTGGYSDAARTKGGSDLSAWVQSHNLAGLDLYCHSHGGSVAMLANHLGTQLGKMILLSCPVHWPKYTPDFTRVTKVISVRVHLDLVILADRGGQKFKNPGIEEHVLPVWFDHFATHSPAVWEKYNVKQWIVGAVQPAAPAIKPADLAAHFLTGTKKRVRIRKPLHLKPKKGTT
jgi:hypothetical protein